MKKTTRLTAIMMILVLISCMMISSYAVSAFDNRRLLGDTDGDGDITVVDVTLILRHLAKAVKPDASAELASDVDRSGGVEVTDATFIQRFLAQMDIPYPVGEPIDPYADDAKDALTALQTRLADAKAAAGEDPVLIRSYDTDKKELSNVAYTYDNALCAMAFLSAGDRADAEEILDAFVYVSEHDRFKPGRIRTAYAADTVKYGESSVKLPGWWEASVGRWYEDASQVGCDVGNTCFAVLALLQYDSVYGSDRYLDTAKALMDWVLSECSDEKDGFTAGFVGWPENNGTGTVRRYKSTEHNIDAYAAFRQLYAVTGEQKYRDAADSALRFVKSMFSERSIFEVGTDNYGNMNRSVIVLDTQVWSAMALGEEYAPYTAALDTVDSMKLTDGGYPFYTENANGGWWAEGTAFTALMFKERGEQDKYGAAMDALCSIQLDDGLFPAATIDHLSTGLSWDYYTDPHICPTAWFIMAVNSFDPYTFA